MAPQNDTPKQHSQEEIEAVVNRLLPFLPRHREGYTYNNEDYTAEAVRTLAYSVVAQAYAIEELTQRVAELEKRLQERDGGSS